MAPVKNRLRKKSVQRLPTPGVPFDGPVRSLVWGRIPGQPWWPGIIVDGEDCGMSAIPSDQKWVFWLEDRRVSKVQSKCVQHFKDHYSLYFDSSRKSKTYESAVVQAIKVCAKRLGQEAEEWTNKQALKWADDGFQQNGRRIVEDAAPVSLPHDIQEDLQLIRDLVQREKRNNGPSPFRNCMQSGKQNNESSPFRNCMQSGKQNNESSPKKTPLVFSAPELKPDVQYDDLEKVKSGKMDIRNLCLGCKSAGVEIVGEHPYFEGSLCKICMEDLKTYGFEFGDDGIHTHCAVCSKPGRVYVCDKPGCFKVYCTPCIELLAAEGAKTLIEETQPWKCFLCNHVMPSVNGIIKPRPESVILSRITALFSANKMSLFSANNIPPFSVNSTPPRHSSNTRKTGLRVLALFDGISTGMVVLDNLNMKIDKYYASEVDTDAINVSKWNYGHMIKQVGAVETLNEKNLRSLGRIDLLLGGSPCTELSLANPARKGLLNTDGSGSLFFEFHRILLTLKLIQRKSFFWLFENTAAMGCKTRATISRYLECNPIIFDAAWLSAQHRTRLFWGNIPKLGGEITKINVKLADCLIPGMNRNAVVEKIRTVTTNSNSLRQGKAMIYPVEMDGNGDTLWMTELEKIFGFPVHYTDTGNLGISKRQQLLGRAWSVPVVECLLKPLKDTFKFGKREKRYRRVIR